MNSVPLLTPQAISQDLLNRSGHAYMTGDVNGFLSCFVLPHTISTFEAVNVITTEDGLRDVFHAMRRYLQSNGLTDLVRRCIRADFTEHDKVKAAHETRFLAGNRLFQGPSLGLSTIRLIDGAWRVSDAQYAIQDAPEHVNALIRPRPDTPS